MRSSTGWWTRILELFVVLWPLLFGALSSSGRSVCSGRSRQADSGAASCCDGLRLSRKLRFEIFLRTGAKETRCEFASKLSAQTTFASQCTSRAKVRSGPKENFKAAHKSRPRQSPPTASQQLRLINEIPTAACLVGQRADELTANKLPPHRAVHHSRQCEASRDLVTPTQLVNSRQVDSGGADFFCGFKNWLEAGSRFSATRHLARKSCLTGEFACKLAGSSFAPASRQFLKRRLRD